ncbi:hypothetical protein QN375_19265 [Pseudomonas sp. MH9.2]|uniref:hypothetical protein n=1 Tax=Pseudomonas sp. MH9.2 TaxID=3048629 RepID=UPI002AC8A876|nr:hypothetical protein [Pseudomonas sp. MH9.2]MEB0027892.1 hypothetical protein [Pseudomonas sp. MH9.2]WPX67662.1 hypothetical protein RHM55_18080 [Pseudomonas sp. MH9.2]
MKLQSRVGGRRRRLGIVLLALFAVALLRWGFQALADEPELALVIGEPWEDMRKRSSAAISPAIPGEVWFGMPKSDARLRVSDPQYGFVTPLARFFTIGFENERIDGIRMSPQIEPLLLDDALKVVLELQDQWRQSGWIPIRQRSAPPFADTPEWRAQLRDVNKGGTTYWQAGDKYQVLLRVHRFKDYKRPDEERYMITLNLGKPWLPTHTEPPVLAR